MLSPENANKKMITEKELEGTTYHSTAVVSGGGYEDEALSIM